MSATTLARDLVVAQTRALKLPGVARTFEALARQARDAHWPHEDYLHEVLTAEQASRHESVIRQRLREARFPEVKTLDTFDFAAADGVSATQIHTLARGEWVTAPENLIFAGPIGTGKTHFAIALGVEATKQKRRVLFTRAADLVRQLLEARDARELTRLQQRLLRVDVLIVDEVGIRPVRSRRRRAALQSDHRSLRAPGDGRDDQSRVCRMGHRVCRRREAHDGAARSLGASRDRDHHEGQKLSDAQASRPGGPFVSAVLMRNIVPSLTEGARRRCRLALSSKTNQRGRHVASSPSQTRRMNILQVVYFLERRTGLVSAPCGWTPTCRPYLPSFTSSASTTSAIWNSG